MRIEVRNGSREIVCNMRAGRSGFRRSCTSGSNFGKEQMVGKGRESTICNIQHIWYMRLVQLYHHSSSAGHQVAVYKASSKRVLVRILSIYPAALRIWRMLQHGDTRTGVSLGSTSHSAPAYIHMSPLERRRRDLSPTTHDFLCPPICF